jgi:DNA-binding NarL/FixJ family response regulator
MPRLEGMEAVRQIHAASPDAQLIILTTDDNRTRH